MKKILWSVAVLSFSGALWAAETISTVSFNPSRMGDYTYLKVSDKATIKSGLKTDELYINPAASGAVSLSFQGGPSSVTATYWKFWIDTDIVGEQYSSINMPESTFRSSASNENAFSSYQSSSPSLPPEGFLVPQVTIKGGTLEFKYDSYLKTLDAINMLRQKTKNLSVSNIFTISGNGGSSSSLYGGSLTYGFHLAGNDIPVPVGAYTNTGYPLTHCTLAWESRKTSDGQSVKVLSLQNCR